MSARARRITCRVALFPARALSAAGGEAADLWALKPVERPAVPAGLTDSANPIDAFVRARLRQAKLEPSPPADPRTLARRVHLVALGLPPTPEEVDAFVADRAEALKQHAEAVALLADLPPGEQRALALTELCREPLMAVMRAPLYVPVQLVNMPVRPASSGFSRRLDSCVAGSSSS